MKELYKKNILTSLDFSLFREKSDLLVDFFYFNLKNKFNGINKYLIIIELNNLKTLNILDIHNEVYSKKEVLNEINATLKILKENEKFFDIFVFEQRSFDKLLNSFISN